MREIELEIEKGTYRPPDRRKTGFDDVHKTFVGEHGSKRRSEHYRYLLMPVLEFCGSKPIEEVTKAHVEDDIAKHLEVVGPSTVRKEVAALGTLLRWFVDRELLSENVVSRVRKPSEPQHRTVYLERADWPKVGRAAPPWLRPMMQLAVVTGLRLKEVVSLTWDDIDRDAGRLHVAEDSKTGYRVVPASPMARAVLKAVPRRMRCRQVFTMSDGETYTAECQRNRVSCSPGAALKRAVFPGFGFHALRHSAGAWMATEGVTLVTIARRCSARRTARRRCATRT